MALSKPLHDHYTLNKGVIWGMMYLKGKAGMENVLH